MVRFRLYLLSSQVALANECLGQADACLEGAISLVIEFSPLEEQWIVSNLSNLLSTLLVQPVRLTFDFWFLIFLAWLEHSIIIDWNVWIFNRTRPTKTGFTIYGDYYVTCGRFPSTTRCIVYAPPSTFKRYVYFPLISSRITSITFHMVSQAFRYNFIFYDLFIHFCLFVCLFVGLFVVVITLQWSPTTVSILVTKTSEWRQPITVANYWQNCSTILISWAMRTNTESRFDLLPILIAFCDPMFSSFFFFRSLSIFFFVFWGGGCLFRFV